MNSSFTCLHGCMLQMYQQGIAITGDAGIGKSDLALQLIDRGHLLISDDIIDLHLINAELIASSPRLTQDLIYIYGIGITNIKKMGYETSILKQHKLDYIIHLSNSKDVIITNPLQPIITEQNILNIIIPKIILPINNNRPLALLIETLLKQLQAKKTGYDINTELQSRKLLATHKEGHHAS